MTVRSSSRRFGSVRARFWLAIALAVLAAQGASARSYWYTGELRSRVRVQIREEFSLSKSSRDFEARLAKFVDYAGPVNRQRIEGYQIVCDPPPDSTAPETDRHGNQFPRLQWARPPTKITCTVSFVATLTTNLEPLGKISEVPWSSASGKGGGTYLKATDLVTSDESEIRDLAKKIRAGSKGQIDAIVAVLNYVVDHLEYHVQPKSYSAIDALESGQGNCQNYSHLAAALLHDIGVEARIVNGVSLTHPWRLPLPSGSLTLDGAQGRHAWLEVNVPGLGWLSFDPQQTHFFVSPHLIRQAMGFDSYEAADKFSAMVSRPKLTETIETQFLDDDNTLELHVEGPTPRNFVVAGLVAPAAAGGTTLVEEGPSHPRRHLVLDESTDQKPSAAVPPRVEERGAPKPTDATPQPPTSKEVAPAPVPPPPPAAFPGRPTPASEPIEPAPKAARPSRPVDSAPAAPGAPRNEEPATSPPPAPPAPPVSTPPKPPTELASKGSESRDAGPIAPSPTTEPAFDELTELGLLDLSEDAYQYATSTDIFAQRFESPTPLQLWDVSLSLQKFGGEPDGQLWVTLHRDVGGVPSEPGGLESVHLKLADLPSDVAFHWVSFSFRHLEAAARLPAGRYWLALHFSPDAIVNWHARIGNPYLDPDDTRSRRAAGGPWDNIINIDFNFLVTGLAPSAGR